MNKQEFIETFAHFMSEHDLNQAYDGHFPQLGNMGAKDIEKWLIPVLTERAPQNIDVHIAEIANSLHNFIYNDDDNYTVISFNREYAQKILQFIKVNTPVKPLYIYEDEPICMNCGGRLDDNEDPCELCGQRIDWSD